MKIVDRNYISELVKDGMTIAVSGMSGYGYPPELIKAVMESDAKNLTLIYIENNSLLDQKFDDVTEIIKMGNGKVKRVICSHLGKLSLKENLHYMKDIQLDIFPMGVLAQKLQAAANGLKGIVVDEKLARVYRDSDYVQINMVGNDLNPYVGVFEPALYSDIALVLGDEMDKYGKVSYHRSMYNSKDVMKSANLGILEFSEFVDVIDFDAVDIESPWVEYAVPSHEVKVEVDQNVK